MERRKRERYVVPEIYRKSITFKVRGVSGDFVDAELFNFTSNGIRIKSRSELPFDSTIECLISVPKPLPEKILLTGKIKYCIQEEPMGDYLIGVEIIGNDDELEFGAFLKVYDFIKERIKELP